MVQSEKYLFFARAELNCWLSLLLYEWYGKRIAVNQGSMVGPTLKDFGDKLIAGLVWLKYIGVCSC